MPHHPNCDLEPYSKHDMWDGNHVRKPNSQGSKYEEINQKGESQVCLRWSLIERSLLTKFESSYQLEKAIKMYNTRYENLWNFSSLHHLIQKELTSDQRQYFLSKLLPDIIGLALRLEYIIACPIPLLKQGMNHSISMTQEQAACLLANAFLCTFPRRNTDKRNSEFANYPEINFNRLFGSDAQKSREKLKCILNYFKRVFKSTSLRRRVITFQRRHIQSFPQWKNESKNFSNIKYHVSASETIETASGCLQVDFANRFVGGGVLGSGSVQEEIRFVINPELIVAKLFTECLDESEALIVTGTEQFNAYSGYASSFKFAGDFQDITPVDDSNRRKCRIVAIDALSYKNYYDQFKEVNLLRDINKAFVGFANNDISDCQPIASGLWGAGAFQGHPVRTAIIQLMACLATRRNLVFYTFGDEVMEFQISDIFQFLTTTNVTLGAIYEILKKFRYSQKTSNVEDLIPFIKKEVISSAKNTSSSSFKFKAPSTSRDDKSRQQTLHEFKMLKPSDVQHHQAPAKIEIENETMPRPKSMPFIPRFNDVKTANSDKARFDAIASKFTTQSVAIFNPNTTLNEQKAEKSQTSRRSLLESLDDDFTR